MARYAMSQSSYGANSQLSVAIVSHDAGGAEILSSYLRRERVPSLLVLEGPALGIFERKLGSLPRVELDEAVSRASWVLCGTGWQSDLEWRAIRHAREAGKRVVAFLDHWINYRERFERHGELCMPDELWVGDDYAARIARGQFSDIPIQLVKNPYFDDIREDLKALRDSASPRADGCVILYVCEPMREPGLRLFGDERYFGYVEEEAVEYFLHNLDAIAADVARVKIRPHPAEPPGKYEWVLGQGSAPIELSVGTTLAEDVAGADVVVGCESMAMVVGLIAGKRVVSAIPPGGRSCALPHDAIELLRDLVSHGRA
jgi:hypothetical protein